MIREYRADGTLLRRPSAPVRWLCGELLAAGDYALLAGFHRLGRALAVVAERIDPMGAYSAEEPEA